MIKFFRKIRQKLLSENKFSKYLIYAIGEIVLVVIGILIALQINNQNIHRQERSIEKNYLVALREEFKINLSKLDETIDLNNEIIDKVDKLIQVFQQEVIDTISETTVVNYFFEAFSTEVNYAPNIGVLTEIISSGNLRLIQNQELKHKLTSFESYLNEIKHQENEINIPRLEIMEHFRNKANYKRYLEELGWDPGWESIYENWSNKELFTTLHFFNSLFFYQITSGAANDYRYLPAKEYMEATLVLINSEINEQ